MDVVAGTRAVGGALCCSDVPPCFKASECDRDVEEKGKGRG